MHSTSSERRRLIGEISTMSMGIGMVLTTSNPSATRASRVLAMPISEAHRISTPALRKPHRALTEFGDEARAAEAQREARRRSRISAQLVDPGTIRTTEKKSDPWQ